DETSRNISSTSTTKSFEVVRQLEMMNKNFLEMMRQFQTIKAVDTKCETCGGPRSFIECPAIGGYTQETAYATTGTGSLPSNTVPNPQEDLKVITTRSGVTLAGPSVSPSSSKELLKIRDIDLQQQIQDRIFQSQNLMFLGGFSLIKGTLGIAYKTSTMLAAIKMKVMTPTTQALDEGRI
nr:reverse transcriptase domain-containing protein [Tanacetum cinerariifolium]